MAELDSAVSAANRDADFSQVSRILSEQRSGENAS
jgi:hypothetical protein